MTMTVTDQDRRFMKQAIALAARGGGKVFPNPRVGCVIVRDGAVAGAGYHEYFGGPHAEVNALAEAGEKARGATLYVTLEPCNHWGKTPPCTEAIAAAGIVRVVAATADTNPKIRGNGFRSLERKGISVVRNVLEREARALNGDYIAWLRKRRRRVYLKAAMTLDGKIAASGGDSKWITGPAARSDGHRLRAGVDAILVGITTVLRDDPELTAHGAGRNPVRVIVDPRLRIPAGSRVLDGQAPTIVVHSMAGDSPAIERLKGLKALPLYIGKDAGGRIDFRDIVRRLNDLSLRTVLIEGGGETAAGALAAGVVDEVRFYIAPKIAGGRAAVSPVEGDGAARMEDSIRLDRMKLRRLGPDIVIEADLRKRRDTCSPE